jgi:site-specific DNA-cytosine methylase
VAFDAQTFVEATSPHSAEEAPRFAATDVAACLTPWDDRHSPPKHMFASRWAVRRLTPLEFERLQGFPDGWRAVLWRGRMETPDGMRFRALGNAMAVNCMEWLGRRIDLVRGLG